MTHLERYLTRKNILCDTLGIEEIPYPTTKEQINTLIERVEKDQRPDNITDYGVAESKEVEQRREHFQRVEAELYALLQQLGEFS